MSSAPAKRLRCLGGTPMRLFSAPGSARFSLGIHEQRPVSIGSCRIVLPVATTMAGLALSAGLFFEPVAHHADGSALKVPTGHATCCRHALPSSLVRISHQCSVPNNHHLTRKSWCPLHPCLRLPPVAVGGGTTHVTLLSPHVFFESITAISDCKTYATIR